MPEKGPKRTILIIEDEPDLQQFAGWTMEAEGYHVLQATEGERGLELAREYLPDLVLLDLRLPYRDGWSVLKEMKSSAALAGIPIVLFTASADMPYRDRALKMGAADYLVKPLSVETLRKCVSGILPLV